MNLFWSLHITCFAILFDAYLQQHQHDAIAKNFADKRVKLKISLKTASDYIFSKLFYSQMTISHFLFLISSIIYLSSFLRIHHFLRIGIQFVFDKNWSPNAFCNDFSVSKDVLIYLHISAACLHQVGDDPDSICYWKMKISEIKNKKIS